MSNQLKAVAAAFVAAVAFLIYRMMKRNNPMQKLAVELLPVEVHNTTSYMDRAARFIAPFEGFIPKAKWDYKQYSYGYGTKAPSSTATITKAQALVELQNFCAGLDREIMSYNVTLTDSQKIGLLSFGFNLGSGTLAKIMKDLQAGKTKNVVADRMKLYNLAGGKKLDGLVDRRQKESDLLIQKTTA